MERIDAICTCGEVKQVLPSTLGKHIKRRGFYLCRACIHKEIWKDPELREKLSSNIKSSEKYQAGIKNRPDNSGENNPMFGKKLSEKTRAKMSASRTGKVGENATAWKGGKDSVYRRVKAAVFRRFTWGQRVLDKDDNKCVKCSSTNKLDAHHIIPFKTIFDEYKLPQELSREEQIEWYLSQAKIIDAELNNGMTLCRECHKKEHTNWGSHVPK
jgi:hypothetical protein